MADDNNARYRSSEPSDRGPDPGGPANDPLAELARLIGRSDPFAEYSRPPATPQEPAAAPPPYRSEPPRYPSDDPIPRFLSEQPRYEPEPRYGHDAPGHADWPGSPPQHQFDPFALPSYQPAPMVPPNDGPRIDPQIFADLHAKLGLSGLQPDRARLGTPDFQFGADPAEPPPLYPHDPVATTMPAHEDEFYDDPPRGNRRKGMLTVAAVLGLAVIGTAGAFGYRSIFSGPSSANAPVIRASGEPSKVAPPPSKVDQSANKFSYDRFGDRGQNEQVVVREEKPVDAQELARSTAPPRNVFPAVPPPAAQAGAPSALGEPKRVRTVQIRPDQPEPSITPQSVGATAPMQLAPGAPPPAARAAAPPPRMAARSTPQPAPAPAGPSGTAPLSLAPETGAPPPAPVASMPAPRAAAPAPRTTASAGGGGGGYLVQVSSQRSEADAQSAYRSLQSRHSGVLNGQPHVIRRADLGERGVYYRAMVGPFGSRDQAIQLCSSLKASGGDCVVQSN